jgi:hypothetical protein
MISLFVFTKDTPSIKNQQRTSTKIKRILIFLFIVHMVIAIDKMKKEEKMK